MKVGKKTRRFALQRLVAEEFLMHWIDFADLQPLGDEASNLLPVEYSEVILFDAIGQLAALCKDTLSMPVPQMWIGSSVALACDGGALPERSRALQALRERAAFAGGADAGLARVQVFDWGRSELNTVRSHALLSKEEQKMRETFWRLWKKGPLRLLFDALNMYTTQFGSWYAEEGTTEPRTVLIKVMDEDSHDASDLIGEASLPLEPTNGPVTLSLSLTLRGNVADIRAHKSEVTVEISRSQPPQDSRLAEIWHVTVHSVSDLPKMDWMSDSDPQVVVLVAPTMRGCYRKNFTPVVYNDNNAEFVCRLDYGVARTDVLDSVFSMLSLALEQHLDPECIPMFLPKVTSLPRWRGPKNEDFENFLAKLPAFAPEAQRQRFPRILSKMTSFPGAQRRVPRNNTR